MESEATGCPFLAFVCVLHTPHPHPLSLPLSLTVFATAKVAVLNALNVAQQLECHIANVYLLFVG